MSFEPPRKRTEIRNPVFDLRSFASRIVLVGIDAAEGSADMKERIMIAWEHGHLSADEAEVMIVERGLAEQ